MGKRHKRWMRVPEVAKYLGVSPQWLYNRTMHGKIPFHRDGMVLLFDVFEINEWARSLPPSRRAWSQERRRKASEDGRAER